MGTKSKPSEFDCHAKAEADEPIFTLRANDPSAWFLVRLWSLLRMTRIARLDKGPLELMVEFKQLDEARACSRAMAEWAYAHGKDYDRVRFDFQDLVVEAIRNGLGDLGALVLRSITGEFKVDEKDTRRK